ASVRDLCDIRLVYWFVEAGPASPGLELGFGCEQRQPAGRAAVSSVVVIVPVRAGERPFSSRLPQHGVLLRRQFLLPLLISLFQLVCHASLLRLCGRRAFLGQKFLNYL